MNKGLGKLILIAGLGLGVLYFLRSDNKKVSNSEIKKETKEHPSLDKETIETIVKDHKEEKKEEPKKKRVLSEERKQRLREQLAKGRARQKENREKRKLTKAEAGALGGEATADLRKHKGHKSKKGLVQDQNLVSKEEHEKHYQNTKGEKR